MDWLKSAEEIGPDFEVGPTVELLEKLAKLARDAFVESDREAREKRGVGELSGSAEGSKIRRRFLSGRVLGLLCKGAKRVGSMDVGEEAAVRAGVAIVDALDAIVGSTMGSTVAPLVLGAGGVDGCVFLCGKWLESSGGNVSCGRCVRLGLRVVGNTCSELGASSVSDLRRCGGVEVVVRACLSGGVAASVRAEGKGVVAALCGVSAVFRRVFLGEAGLVEGMFGGESVWERCWSCAGLYGLLGGEEVEMMEDEIREVAGGGMVDREGEEYDEEELQAGEVVEVAGRMSKEAEEGIWATLQEVATTLGRCEAEALDSGCDAPPVWCVADVLRILALCGRLDHSDGAKSLFMESLLKSNKDDLDRPGETQQDLIHALQTAEGVSVPGPARLGVQAGEMLLRTGPEESVLSSILTQALSLLQPTPPKDTSSPPPPPSFGRCLLVYGILRTLALETPATNATIAPALSAVLARSKDAPFAATAAVWVLRDAADQDHHHLDARINLDLLHPCLPSLLALIGDSAAPILPRWIALMSIISLTSRRTEHSEEQDHHHHHHHGHEHKKEGHHDHHHDHDDEKHVKKGEEDEEDLDEETPELPFGNLDELGRELVESGVVEAMVRVLESGSKDDVALASGAAEVVGDLVEDCPVAAEDFVEGGMLERLVRVLGGSGSEVVRGACLRCLCCELDLIPVDLVGAVVKSAVELASGERVRVVGGVLQDAAQIALHEEFSVVVRNSEWAQVVGQRMGQAAGVLHQVASDGVVSDFLGLAECNVEEASDLARATLVAAPFCIAGGMRAKVSVGLRSVRGGYGEAKWLIQRTLSHEMTDGPSAWGAIKTAGGMSPAIAVDEAIVEAALPWLRGEEETSPDCVSAVLELLANAPVLSSENRRAADVAADIVGAMLSEDTERQGRGCEAICALATVSGWSALLVDADVCSVLVDLVTRTHTTTGLLDVIVGAIHAILTSHPDAAQLMVITENLPSRSAHTIEAARLHAHTDHDDSIAPDLLLKAHTLLGALFLQTAPHLASAFVTQGWVAALATALVYGRGPLGEPDIVQALAVTLAKIFQAVPEARDAAEKAAPKVSDFVRAALAKRRQESEPLAKFHQDEDELDEDENVDYAAKAAAAAKAALQELSESLPDDE